LWFAFKIYIFGFLIQQSASNASLIYCCDLLSKFISLAFWYNKDIWQRKTITVVICFQNLYLWLSDTTEPGRLYVGYSCDLLSKFISLAFWYNLQSYGLPRERVVICFQNLYLWLSDTTTERTKRVTAKLWFAFKIYIFGFLIQRGSVCW